MDLIFARLETHPYLDILDLPALVACADMLHDAFIAGGFALARRYTALAPLRDTAGSFRLSWNVQG